MSVPDFLTHYYEFSKGPFRNLSFLAVEQAESILQELRAAGGSFASQRSSDYLAIRRGLEEKVRSLFVNKGGRPRLARPHYMILGVCPWVMSWYQDGREVRIPLAAFDPLTISFTYGDTFPAMRYPDGKPYRGQVFTLAEIPEIVRLYGLPQDCNSDGKAGPDRYIEAQVWEDGPIRQFLGS